jgi:hypothetical protein
MNSRVLVSMESDPVDLADAKMQESLKALNQNTDIKLIFVE